MGLAGEQGRVHLVEAPPFQVGLGVITLANAELIGREFKVVILIQIQNSQMFQSRPGITFRTKRAYLPTDAVAE